MANLKRADLSTADLGLAHLHAANLEFANLEGAVLFRANLAWANLRGGRLSRADLTLADLSTANLLLARFDQADLKGANLKGANLHGANLEGANLEGANLEGANLNGANLNGANLKHAYLNNTVLSDVDLSAIRDLGNCKHGGPSILDNRTLARSRAVPIEFWQGCGIPDWQIQTVKLFEPNLTLDDVISITYEVARIRGGQPIQLFSPFISYSSKDEAFARRLYDDLQGCGVRCWYAPEDMKIGDRIRSRIDEVIHVYDKLLLVLSEHSVASHWVEKEVETAFEKERETGEAVLFPIKIDGAVDDIKAGWAADIRRSRHIGDFTKSNDVDAYQASFDRMLQDLRAMP